MSVARKRFKTAFPKEPVPPVIMRVLFLKSDIFSPSNQFLFLLNKAIETYTLRNSFLTVIFHRISLHLTILIQSTIILSIEPATPSHVPMNAQPGGTFYIYRGAQYVPVSEKHSEHRTAIAKVEQCWNADHCKRQC